MIFAAGDRLCGAICVGHCDYLCDNGPSLDDCWHADDDDGFAVDAGDCSYSAHAHSIISSLFEVSVKICAERERRRNEENKIYECLLFACEMGN